MKLEIEISDIHGKMLDEIEESHGDISSELSSEVEQMIHNTYQKVNR